MSMVTLFIKNLGCSALLAGLVWAPLLDGAQAAALSKIPPFTHTRSAEWINSKPLTVTELRGSVVLVEFWAFDCVNCLHSAAWLESVVDAQAAAGLVVIGVHTPELPQERVTANVRDAVTRLGIKYPVMLDADYSYWNALNNRYWPAFYLIDRDGRIRAQATGEIHVGDPNALQLESDIKQLLAARN
jgi:thiol-disulfide isomerase/thioredoxin